MKNKSPLTKREAKRLARLDQLLSTAMEMIARDGLDTFSLHKLAAAVDLTVGALYRYFPSKGALVAALENRVIEDTGRVLNEAIERVDAFKTKPPENIHSLVRLIMAAYAYRDRLHTAPEQMRLIGGLMSNPHPLLKQSEAEQVLGNMLTILRPVSQAIEDSESLSLLRPGNSMRRALLTWASLRGVAETRKLGLRMPEVFDEEALFETAVTTLLVGWGADYLVVQNALNFTQDRIKETP
jgi:AcrR family transcriptional regulator